MLGNCVLEERIAQGGMGVVYRARELTSERLVAVKVIAANPMGCARRALERFIREARSAARIHHENVVAVYDAGIERAFGYMVMEFVDGADLKRYVAEHGVLSIEWALRVMLGAARGLEAAHETGIIHRDVKPANLLLSSCATVKLVDFGLGKRAGDTSLTRPGAIVGTPDYMSPEACRGRSLDVRSDLYSLGASLYYLLTGEPPFGRHEGDVPAVLLKHSFEPPPRLSSLRSDVPAPLCSLAEELLAKDPEARPASARALIERLESLLPCVSGGSCAPELPASRVSSARADDATGLGASARRSRSRDVGRAKEPTPQYTLGTLAGNERELFSWLERVPESETGSTDRIVLDSRDSIGAEEGDDEHGETVGSRLSERSVIRSGAGNDATLRLRELLLRGRLHLEAKRWRKAARDFQRALVRNDALVVAWVGLVQSFGRLPGRQDDAVAALRKAIEIGLRDPDTVRRVVAGTLIEDDARVVRLREQVMAQRRPARKRKETA